MMLPSGHSLPLPNSSEIDTCSTMKQHINAVPVASATGLKKAQERHLMHTLMRQREQRYRQHVNPSWVHQFWNSVTS
jgi:hypothetical protein